MGFQRRGHFGVGLSFQGNRSPFADASAVWLFFDWKFFSDGGLWLFLILLCWRLSAPDFLGQQRVATLLRMGLGWEMSVTGEVSSRCCRKSVSIICQRVTFASPDGKPVLGPSSARVSAVNPACSLSSCQISLRF